MQGLKWVDSWAQGTHYMGGKLATLPAPPISALHQTVLQTLPTLTAIVIAWIVRKSAQQIQADCVCVHVCVRACACGT